MFLALGGSCARCILLITCSTPHNTRNQPSSNQHDRLAQGPSSGLGARPKTNGSLGHSHNVQLLSKSTPHRSDHCVPLTTLCTSLSCCSISWRFLPRGEGEAVSAGGIAVPWCRRAAWWGWRAQLLLLELRLQLLNLREPSQRWSVAGSCVRRGASQRVATPCQV